jgi:hypothetical protein
MSDRDALIRRAQARASASATPDEWGYRVQLGVGDSFTGRYRGETSDQASDDRRVFLLWDDDGDPCWSRSYASLGREMERARPTIGDSIAIVRGEDYPTGYGNPGQSYGLEVESCADLLPETEAARDDGKSAGHDDDDGVPF